MLRTGVVKTCSNKTCPGLDVVGSNPTPAAIFSRGEAGDTKPVILRRLARKASRFKSYPTAFFSYHSSQDRQLFRRMVAISVLGIGAAGLSVIALVIGVAVFTFLFLRKNRAIANKAESVVKDITKP